MTGLELLEDSNAMSIFSMGSILERWELSIVLVLAKIMIPTEVKLYRYMGCFKVQSTGILSSISRFIDG